MERAKGKASEFELCLNSLGAKLSSYEALQQEEGPVCSDALGLKRQLGEHKVREGGEGREKKPGGKRVVGVKG